jgi:hypothetical protein
VRETLGVDASGPGGPSTRSSRGPAPRPVEWSDGARPTLRSPSKCSPAHRRISRVRSQRAGSRWPGAACGPHEATRVPAALRALLNRRVAAWNGCEF